MIRFRTLLLLLILAVTSCQKEIDMSVPESERKLVLNGLIFAGEPFTISVSKSKSLLEKSMIESVDNAEIRIFEGDTCLASLDTAKGIWYYNYIWESPGYEVDTVFRTLYHSGNIIAEEGKTYRIEAGASGIKSKASAEFKVPSKIPILKIDTATVKSTDQYTNYQQFNIQISDPAAENNFYLLYLKTAAIYSMTNEFGDTLTQSYEYYESIESDDLIFRNNEDLYVDNGLVFNDLLFNGKTENFKFRAFKSYWGQSVRYYVILQNISEAYYNYIITCSKYNNTENNPIAEPVSVTSNVTGGFGIVTAVNESVDSSVFIKAGIFPGYK